MPQKHYGWLSPREWLITGLTFLGCCLLLYFKVPCLVRLVLGIPCPTCGISRAWLAALHLDFKAAFSYHPMFWSVPILYFYILRLCRLFRNPRVNRGILGGILLGFAINYICILVEWFY